MARLRTDRLDRLIEQSPLSIGGIAEAAGISPEYLWKLRKGKVPNVSAVNLAALAEVLDVPVGYLLGEGEEPGQVPVPEPDIAPMVDALNALPENVRALLREVFDVQLRLLVALADDEKIDLLTRLHERLPLPARLEIEREAVRRAREAAQEAQHSDTAREADEGKESPNHSNHVKANG